MSDKETFELIVVEGRRKWLCSNGRLLPYVAGGSGDGDPSPKPDDPLKPGDPPPKTFTQEEVNAIIQRRISGARDTAQADLMKELGITDAEEAKKLLKAAKDAEEANATELDKAKRDKAESDTRTASATAELADSKLTTSIEKELVRAGLTVEGAERVRRLVDVQKNDAEEIKTAIEALKTEMPALFSTEGNGERPNSNPGGPPPGGGGKPINDPQAEARKTLYERHPNLKKT